jgi:8-oxo-dGTP pyrophosphatase MutT (NUDIX family)
MPHIHEKIDFTIEVFVVYKNRVLLRKHDKYKLWLSVGGHIELDEDPIQAAIREVKEEIGLELELLHKGKIPKKEGDYQELLPPRFLNRHRIKDNHEHITLTYFARTKTDKLKLSNREKTEECKWFSLEELENPEYQIKEHIKKYAKTALILAKEF